MSILSYRFNKVETTSAAGNLQPASSYTVVAYAAGAQVTSVAGATITVRAGHGFANGQKCMVNTDTTKYAVVSNVAATQLDTTPALVVVAGDYLVNLGADGGLTSPDFDGSSVTIYSDMDGTTAVTESTLTTNSDGEYGYWYGASRIWELVLSGSTPLQLLPDAVVPSETVRYATQWATDGAGTSGDPWTGWELCLAASTRIHFPAGIYRTAGISSTNNGMVLTGDGPTASVIQSTAAAGDGLKIDLTAAGNAGLVTIRDIAFQQVTNALNSGSILLNIAVAPRVYLDNVLVLGSSTSDLTTSGVAIALTDVNLATVVGCYIQGYEAPGGKWGVGFDIGKSVTANRGNISFLGGGAERCLTGVRVASGATNAVNNIHVNDFKIVAAGALVSGSIGLDLYGQAYNVVLNNAHIEWNETAIRAASMTGLIVEGCYIQGWGAGTTGAILLNTGCDHIRIQHCWFTNAVAASAGVYAIELDASEHNFLDIGPNKYTYGAGLTTEPNQILNNSTSTSVGQLIFDNTNKWHFRDTGIRVGRNIDEQIRMTFDRASGDAYLQWSEANSRFEFSTSMYSDGGIGAGSVVFATTHLQAGGDSGSGTASRTSFTNATSAIAGGTNAAAVRHTTSGQVQAGWIKIYVGTTAYYIPYWAGT